MIDSSSAATVLGAIHLAASKKYRCGELRNWRGPGRTFVLNDDLDHKVEFICTPLVNSEVGDFLLNIADKRGWRSIFSFSKCEHVLPVVIEVVPWLKAAGVKNILWAREIVPDFESIDSWDQELKSSDAEK